jgi:hypothetical protein
MTDIVERLRDKSKHSEEDCYDAADEIETLRLRVASLEATIHQVVLDEWFGFEQTQFLKNFEEALRFVKNYDRLYGTLHFRKDYDGRFWLKERMFAAVDVEWTTIYGPLSEDQIQELKNTGKIYS